ncbi:hypothetical protein GO755_25870 [Spirosoma sp. HMF4905]|uniref:Uncharacterized protein n=1 Tax=Spirosoma arboris TaxID=2682092 RepID=A0A7K1SI39_9BACT|nr:contractile injection system tape measure protein [Spirosoma arboris]MVM33491.1 hypothetical protein [Spirosoma arboris]
MTHIIRQQYVHIDLNGTESEGMALHSQLPELCRNWLLPAIERALDRCAPSDGHLYIDRLEIDAGVVSLDRLEQDIVELVERALEQSIQLQNSLVDVNPGQSDHTSVRKTNAQSVTEAFVYFLKTGSLPWFFRLPVGKTLEQVLLDSWHKESEATITRRAFVDSIRSILSSAPVRNRLIRQFSPVFLEILFTRLSPANQPILHAVLTVLHATGSEPAELALVTRQLWETAFVHLAEHRQMTEQQIVSEVWHTLPIVKTDRLKQQLERHWPSVTQSEKWSTQPPTIEQKNDEVRQNPENEEAQQHTQRQANGQLSVQEGVYVDHAGLVLLHPFLAQFFGALGIAQGDQLVQPERALCLLYYLATGQTVAPEYELLLPKVLCNLPMDMPVESDVALTATELEEADVLLRTVVRYWEALRNTSTDALRGTFLIRPGKLSLRADGDWLLQVETASFDILVDQLPWLISRIQLPWMKTMLRVEWQ